MPFSTRLGTLCRAIYEETRIRLEIAAERRKRVSELSMSLCYNDQYGELDDTVYYPRLYAEEKRIRGEVEEEIRAKYKRRRT